MKRTSGQSTVEYILLATAVIVVAIAFMAKNGYFAKAVNNTLNSPAEMIDASNQKILFQPAN